MATLKEQLHKARKSHRESMSQSTPISAIAAGLTIEMAGTLFISVVVVMYAVGSMFEKRIFNTKGWEILMDPTSIYATVGNIFGGLLSILAGYICAHLVNQREYFYTFIMATVMAILVVLTSLQFNAVLYISVQQIIAIGLTLFGAWIHLYTKKRNEAKTDPLG